MLAIRLDEANYPRKYSQLWYGWEYPNRTCLCFLLCCFLFPLSRYPFLKLSFCCFVSVLLVIVICFVYSCISPIILPVGAVFFLGSWLVYKNHILIVYNPIYESGGTMFPMACHRTLIGLVCGQLTLIGYSIMRFGFYQVITITQKVYLKFCQLTNAHILTLCETQYDILGINNVSVFEFVYDPSNCFWFVSYFIHRIFAGSLFL